MASAVSYATDAELIAAGAEFRILRDRLSRGMSEACARMHVGTGNSRVRRLLDRYPSNGCGHVWLVINAFGTFETCRPALNMYAHWGRSD
jgi:hypothetical protein